MNRRYKDTLELYKTYTTIQLGAEVSLWLVQQVTAVGSEAKKYKTNRKSQFIHLLNNWKHEFLVAVALSRS